MPLAANGCVNTILKMLFQSDFDSEESINVEIWSDSDGIDDDTDNHDNNPAHNYITQILVVFLFYGSLDFSYF